MGCLRLADEAPTLRVGTSGWSFRHWQARFYPPALGESDWLAYYAGQLALVEIDQSSFELPGAGQIRQWVDDTPSAFKFSIRAPRRITHEKKLKGCGAELLAFCARLGAFGDRLGPAVFQLPAQWRCNLRRLETFLATLPHEYRFTFEFPNPSWHTPAVYELLAEHRCALCEFEGRALAISPALSRADPAWENETDFAYLRLGRLPPPAPSGHYSTARLRSWVGQTRTWNRHGKDVYVVFDNQETSRGPVNAQRFVRLARERVR